MNVLKGKGTFRHLGYADRIKIEALQKTGTCVKEIAAYIGCSVSTVYRELKRGSYKRLTSEWETVSAYSADIAQRDYDYRATAKGAQLKVGDDHAFAAYIEQKIISERYSPAAVLGEIRARGLAFQTTVCVKTLYNYIDRRVFLRLSNEHLPRRKDSKRSYCKVHVRTKKPLCEGIEARPADIQRRIEIGHWEMDTVIGKAKGKGQALLVLTERSTRQEIIMKLRHKTTAEVVHALNRLERRYGRRFPLLFKSITVDNGAEFMDCTGMEKSYRTKAQRTKIYYCHPYSAWERGSNENANAMIRRFIPKGTPIEDYSEQDIQRIQDWMNRYPRKILDYKCSDDLFLAHLKTL